MKFTDAAWRNLWQPKPYSAARPDYACGPGFGSTAEPLSSLWCASLLAPLRLSEPFTILDWGCGDGRLFNFLSERFCHFAYYGLERPGPFGEACVARAKDFFGRDARAVFDVYGNDTECKAIDEAHAIVMGSIATHIPFPHFADIVARFSGAFQRGAVLVASFFLRDEYRFAGGAAYGHENCYGWVSYRKDQLDQLCSQTGLAFAEVDVFTENADNVHNICVFHQGKK